jgi:hypothetical protein
VVAVVVVVAVVAVVAVMAVAVRAVVSAATATAIGKQMHSHYLLPLMCPHLHPQTHLCALRHGHGAAQRAELDALLRQLALEPVHRLQVQDAGIVVISAREKATSGWLGGRLCV